jgi:hypothetical protein
VGVLWKLNRVTGKYEDSAQTLFQNVYEKIDPKTGIPTYRKDVLEAKIGDWISSCPGPAGGHDWPATSYDPGSDLMVIPLHQSCVLMRAEPMERKIGVGGNSASQKLFEMPGTHGNLGKLAAYNTKTMKAEWSFQQKSPFLTGVLTTSGGVGFVGDFDRRFRAFETKTGKSFVADKAAHQRAGPCRQLCGGRQAIYRGGNRPGRRQPGGQTHHLAPQRASSQQWQCDLCLRLTGQLISKGDAGEIPSCHRSRRGTGHYLRRPRPCRRAPISGPIRPI